MNQRTMFGDTTFPDANRLAALDDAPVGFVMDEEEFRALYDRTARGLWAYLVRITGDRHRADDLLQETFYRFLRANTMYDSESHRRNSLYRIATNLARDARRRDLNRPAGGWSGDDVELLPDRDHGSATERKTDCARALSQLKPRERAMLWLAYAEGASHSEIAEILGVRPASLKLLLFRARRKLAVLLGVA